MPDPRSVLRPIALLVLSSAACMAPDGEAGPGARGGPEVVYEVSFPNAAHHEAEIQVTFSEVGVDALELRMSRTSPGRYALHEFAKNVYDVRITGAEGATAEISRPDLHEWDVAGHGGAVVVRYTLYGDRADGTYAGIDVSQGHLNMPASFMWARGLEGRPIRVRFMPPEGSGWEVATQLAPTEDPFEFTAPDLAYFLDSPTHLGNLTVRSWVAGEGDDAQTVSVALHHDGTDEEADRFSAAVRRIVDEERAIYGELPSFDFGSYTFIATYLPWAYGDGMEHRNSTILTSSSSLRANELGLLGTVAHEFFHAWNVERIRPEALEPFDFEAANVSDALWLAEGFTSYYDDLALRRAGLIDDDEFARRLGGAIDAVSNQPGRRLRSPAEMSRQAPFVDAAVSIDPQNTGNVFVSYYTWGSVVAAGFDLSLRAGSGEIALDDFMRELWVRHGRTEVPYTLTDAQRILGDVAGDPELAEEFFDRYVLGTDVPDFETLLARAGFVVRPANAGRASFGWVSVSPAGGGLVVTENTLLGEPLYVVGIDRGDRILTLDGAPAGEGLSAVAAAHSPGDLVPVSWESRGRRFEGEIVLAEDPTVEVVTFEASGRELSEERVRFRARWLESRVSR